MGGHCITPSDHDRIFIGPKELLGNHLAQVFNGIYLERGQEQSKWLD